MKKLLTAPEVADALSVGERTVYAWAESGHLPAIKLGPATLRFDPDAIEAWVVGRSVGRTSAVAAPAAPTSTRVSRLRAAVSQQAQVSGRLAG